jgi:hypothetical protein
MPNVNRESLEARQPRRSFSYAIVNAGPPHFDVFKVQADGRSEHLASFRTEDAAFAFVESLPPTRVVQLLPLARQ